MLGLIGWPFVAPFAQKCKATLAGQKCHTRDISQIENSFQTLKRVHSLYVQHPVQQPLSVLFGDATAKFESNKPFLHEAPLLGSHDCQKVS